MKKVCISLILIAGLSTFAGTDVNSFKVVQIANHGVTLDQVCPEVVSKADVAMSEIQTLPQNIVSYEVSKLIANSISNAYRPVFARDQNSLDHFCARIESATKNALEAISSIKERHSILDNAEYHLRNGYTDNVKK